MLTVLYWLIVFWAGFLAGYLMKSWLSAVSKKYGTIVVTEDDLSNKTVYSLILDDYPDQLKFQKTVVFKVEKMDRE